jgi:hypothetical protein
VQNQNDGLTNATRQNPINDGINPTYVYVRVRNRGKYVSQGTEDLKLYWSKAATNLTWPQHRDGSITMPLPNGTGSASLGDIISTLTIPPIEPMSQTIMQFTWMPPNPSDYDSFNSQKTHFCLLARIDAPTVDPMFNETTTGIWNLGSNVKNNNNIIWKNLSVIDNNPAFHNPNFPDIVTNGTTFYTGNTSEEPITFDLIFENIYRRSGNYITEDAEVSIQLDNNVWALWEKSGFQSEGINIINDEEHLIRVTSSNAKIIGIEMNGGFLGQLSVKINFLEEAFPFEQEYDYNVRQVLTQTDSTLGGEGIKIYPPNRSGIIANAGLDHKISAGDSVELRAFDIDEGATYNWYDENNELFHNGLSVFVSPSVEQEYKLEVISDLDGIKDYDKVKVSIRESQIIQITPNPASDLVSIAYELENVQNASILIIKTYGGTISYPISVNTNNLSIDVSGLLPGLYYLSLICDGSNVDSKTLMRN